MSDDIDRIDIYEMPNGEGMVTLVGHIWPTEGWDAEAFPKTEEEQREIIDILSNEYPHAYSDGDLLYVGIWT